jgi:hypothetical protein
MTNRKGELTSSQLDREYPHQIALPADQCTGDSGRGHREFCADLSLAPRHHTVRREDRDYIVYCFADPTHATIFITKFGGEKFNPKDRGRGHGWHHWRLPPTH